MKSHNLETFYNKISKHILLAQSFTEIDSLSFIIKSCRLKPYQIIESKNYDLVLQRWWFDEFGNSLKIVKDKRIKIIYNDLSLNRDYINCTDLYYGLSVNRVVKMSKLGMFFFLKEEDFNSDAAFLAFLGIDNYLRCFMFLHDNLIPISPLYLGMNNLKIIYKHLDIKYFAEIKNIKNYPIPCNSGSAWLSFLPMRDDFLDKIKDQPDNVLQLIKGF